MRVSCRANSRLFTSNKSCTHTYTHTHNNNTQDSVHLNETSDPQRGAVCDSRRRRGLSRGREERGTREVYQWVWSASGRGLTWCLLPTSSLAAGNRLGENCGGRRRWASNRIEWNLSVIRTPKGLAWTHGAEESVLSLVKCPHFRVSKIVHSRAPLNGVEELVQQ